MDLKTWRERCPFQKSPVQNAGNQVVMVYAKRASDETSISFLKQCVHASVLWTKVLRKGTIYGLGLRVISRM
jgi:hypothetical protein